MKHNKTNRFIALIIVLLFLIAIIVSKHKSTIQTNYTNPINSITPATALRQLPTQQPFIDINKLISYNAPTGWKVDRKGSGYVTFVSPAHKLGTAGYVSSGAEIALSNGNMKSSLTAKQAADNSGATSKSTYINTTIGGKDAINVLQCGDGCWDTYYVSDGNYVWTITLQNNDEDQKNKKYYSEFQKFIESINFK